MSDQEDDARLRLGVDYTQVTGANNALDQFGQRANQAGSAAKSYGDSTQNLSRQLQEMLAAQQRTNDLLTQSLNATRQLGAETDAHAQRMTRLAAGVTAAAGAYALFHQRSQEAAAGAQQDIDRISSSIDQLTNKLQSLTNYQTAAFRQSAEFGAFLNMSTAPLLGPAGLSGNGATNTTLLLNAILPAVQSSLAPMMQQIMLAISQQSLRTGVAPQTLLGGVNVGTQLGIGGQQGADLVARMQKNLQGFDEEAIMAQRTLRQFGVTTTDANAATRQFLQALNTYQDSPARQRAFAAEFPGADPGILTRGTLSRLSPVAGGEAAFNQARDAELAQIRAYTSNLEQQNQEYRNTAKTEFFGLLPSMNAIQTSPNYSFWDPRYSANANRFATQEDQLGQIANTQGFLPWLKALGSVVGSEARSDFSALTFGMISPPKAPATSGENRPSVSMVDPGLAEALENFNMHLGRFTPQALQTRLNQESRTGQAIVSQIRAINPEEADAAQKDVGEGLQLLATRLRRVQDPIEGIIENLGKENYILGLPLQQQGEARFIGTLEQNERERTGRGLGDTERQAASLAYQQGVYNRGSLAMEGQDRQIQLQKDLAAAYQNGGSGIQELIAAEKAHEEVLKGTIAPTQELAEKMKLMQSSFEDLSVAAAKMIDQARVQTAATARIAGAGGNPVAVRQADIENEVAAKLHDLQMAAGWDPHKQGEAQRDAQALRTELESQLRNRATAATQAGTYQAGQTRRTLNQIVPGSPGPTSSIATPEGSAMLTQADTEVASMLSHQGQRFSAACAILVNEALKAAGYMGSGSNLASSFKTYGTGVSAADVHRGDIFYSGPSGWGDTGHVGVTLGPVVNGRVQVMSSHMQGDPSNPAGVEYRNAANLMFRRPGGGTAAAAAITPNAGAANNAIAQAQAQEQARQFFEQQGVTPSSQQLAAKSAELMATQFAHLAETAQEAVNSQGALNKIESERAAATLAGPAALQQLDDTEKVLNETQKLLANTTGETAGQFKTLSGEIAANVVAQRANANAAAVAKVIYDQQLNVRNANEQIGAFNLGGLNAMNDMARLQPIRQQLLNADPTMDPQVATQTAAQFAAMAQKAADIKTALQDAAASMTHMGTSALGDIWSDLTDEIGKPSGIRYGLEKAGLQISSMGFDQFVKQPFNTFLSNGLSGRGWNFNIGQSGMTQGDAMGAVLSHAFGGTSDVGGADTASGLGSGTGGTGVGSVANSVVAATGGLGKSLVSSTVGQDNTIRGGSATNPLYVRIVGGGDGSGGGAGGNGGNGAAKGGNGGSGGSGGPSWSTGLGWDALAGGAGAGIGALVDRHNPMLGAGIGAAGGLGLNLIGGALFGNGAGGGGLLGSLFGNNGNGLFGNGSGSNSGLQPMKMGEGDTTGSGGLHSGGNGYGNAPGTTSVLGGLVNGVGKLGGDLIKNLFGSKNGSSTSLSETLFGNNNPLANLMGNPGWGGGDLSAGGSSDWTGALGSGIYGSDVGSSLGDADMSVLGDSSVLGSADSWGESSLTDAFGFHTGGPVGSGGTRRQVPVDLFYNAPRYHSGLRPGEVPAILETGETVTPRGGSAAAPTPDMSPSRNFSLTQNIYTPDANSFRATMGQTAQRTSTAMRAAERNS